MRVYGRLAKPTHITNQIGERLDVIIVPRPVFLIPMRRRIRIGMYDRRVEYPPRGTAHGHTRPGARGQRRRVLRAHLPGRSPNKAPTRRCRAAPATRRAMCRLMATSIPACNSRCPPAMYASKNSSISGLLPAAPGSALHQYGRSGRMLEVRPLRLMLALSGAGVHGRQYARASIQDCEKSFARTGIPSENLLKKRPDLVQIHNFDPASPRST